MSGNNFHKLMLIYGLNILKERKGVTIYSLSKKSENFYSYKKIVQTIFSHLSYAPLKSFRIHEEVIPPEKDKLLKKIENDGKFTWPILISRKVVEEINTYLEDSHPNSLKEFEKRGIIRENEKGDFHIVLDGTHRTACLWELAEKYGFKKAPVLMFDYLGNRGKEVKLGHWCRLTPWQSLNEKRKSFENLVADGILTKLEDNPYMLQENNKIPLVVRGGELYTFQEYLNSQPKAKEIPLSRDYELSKMYLEVNTGVAEKDTCYVEFEEAKKWVEVPEKVVVLPRKLSKLDVLGVTWQKKVFPRKTTRHIFPFRVFNLPIKFSFLKKEEGTIREDLRTLVEEEDITLHLVYLGKEIYLKEEKGRFYEEHMFKFEKEE